LSSMSFNLTRRIDDADLYEHQTSKAELEVGYRFSSNISLETKINKNSQSKVLLANEVFSAITNQGLVVKQDIPA
jgi:hypothetical protein